MGRGAVVFGAIPDLRSLQHLMELVTVVGHDGGSDSDE